MAALLDGPVTPQDGTVFTRQVPTPANLLLNQLLPDETTNATEIDLGKITKRGRTARFRVHDGPAHRSSRDQMVINRIPMLPLTDAKPVRGEQEIARLYGLGVNSNTLLTPAAEAIYDDLQSSTEDIYRRAELARGSVLSTGTLPLNEGGLVGTIDYGVPAGNKITATGSAAFSQTGTADVIGFLNAARQVYIGVNGFGPGVAWTSTQVLTWMQQNVKLQSSAIQTYGTTGVGSFPGLLPQNAINALLGNYQLPGVTQIYDTIVDVDGVNTPVMPNNIIVLGPPAGYRLGATKWGPTVTAQKLAAAGTIQETAPGVVGFVDVGDEFPYKEQVIADSLMLPELDNPEYLMILTVG